jgi:RNA polymerase sigma factor (sigma-70 family)
MEILTMSSIPIDLNVLIERVAHRDAAALKALYDATSGRLYALALRIVVRSEWAEDVLQDTFISVWRNAGSYKASLSPAQAWLGLMLRSRALDLLRRQKVQRNESLVTELDEATEQTVAGDSPDPEALASLSEEAFILQQCLGQLDESQRQVITLAYLQEQTHQELAQRLQMPLGTVKTWIRRGLGKLRVCMERLG